jgi:hypothetical protein
LITKNLSFRKEFPSFVSDNVTFLVASTEVLGHSHDVFQVSDHFLGPRAICVEIRLSRFGWASFKTERRKGDNGAQFDNSAGQVIALSLAVQGQLSRMFTMRHVTALDSIRCLLSGKTVLIVGCTQVAPAQNRDSGTSPECMHNTRFWEDRRLCERGPLFQQYQLEF